MDDKLFHFASGIKRGGDAAVTPTYAVDVRKLVDDTVGEYPVIGGAEEFHTASKQRREVYHTTKRDVLDEYRASPHPRGGGAPSQWGEAWSRLRRALRRLLGTPQTRLHAAILSGDDERARRALGRLVASSNPGLINAPPPGGSAPPPLSCAVKVRNYGAVDLLLDCDRVDVNAADGPSGLAPLHHAVRVRSADLAGRILRRADAAADVADASGTTPLMMACEAGKADVVRVLLEEGGADPGREDDFGWNALFYACYGGNVKVVQMILDEGVNRRRRDKKNYRAYDWAKHMGHGAVVSLLERHRSRMSTAPSSDGGT